MAGDTVQPGPGDAGRQRGVVVELIDQGGRRFFRLTSGQQSIDLTHGGSLNEWVATGRVPRHSLTVSGTGISIDGRKYLYDDPQAVEQLTKLLNATSAGPRQQAVPAKPKAAHRAPVATTPDAMIAAVAQSVKVVRTGFEYHVLYNSKFGEKKNEKLDAALEDLQRMGIFRPHIGLQRYGIRIVMTRWDGEEFKEIGGIEDLEHSTPEEVEGLLKKCLRGLSDSEAQPAKASAPSDPIVSLEVAKRARDNWFHLVLHRQSGATEAGALLTRPNVAKLQEEGFFPPDVQVSMTALNDRIRVVWTEKMGNHSQKREEVLPLTTAEEAAAVTAVLNECWRAASVAPASPGTLKHVELEPKPAQKEGPTPAPTPSPRAAPQARPVAPAPSQAPARPSPKPSPAAATSAERPNWLTRRLEEVAAMKPEEVNREIFRVLQERFRLRPVTTEHGFPRLELDWHRQEPKLARMAVALTTRFLVCETNEGYLRFGNESRIFSSKSDDFVELSEPVLRGLAQVRTAGHLVFLVTPSFQNFVNRSGKEYKELFSAAIVAVPPVPPELDVLWPLSHEQRIFAELIRTARNYGLPIDPGDDRIVLNPGAEDIVCFRKVDDHGLQLCHGADQATFLPDKLEMQFGESTVRHPGPSGLLGWGLDPSGKMCAIVTKGTALPVPEGNKLFRVVSEEQVQELNILCYLPRAPFSVDRPQ